MHALGVRVTGYCCAKWRFDDPEALARGGVIARIKAGQTAG